MLKTIVIFCAVSTSRFHRNCRSVKKRLHTGAKTSGKKTKVHCRTTVLRWVKATAVAGMLVAGVSANAQHCNTFVNADAANPLLSAMPPGHYPVAVNFIDIDHDGDLDCYVSDNTYDTPVLYVNVGNAHHPVFKKSGQNGFPKDIYIHATPYIQFVDIDGDGDYDCFYSDNLVGGYYYTSPRFFENIGTPQKPDFVENEAKNPVGNIKSGNYVSFTFADIDGDGDLDFYYYDHSTYAGFPSYYAVISNTGTPQLPVFTNYYSYDESNTFRGGALPRIYYDWNKDGLLDYFDGTAYYKNIGPKSAPQYVLDNADDPVFENGNPFRFVDLNGDGALEVFTNGGHYATLAPVAVIAASQVIAGGKKLLKFTSVNQSPAYRYRWERNGQVIPAATQPTLFTPREGTYTLYVTDSCGTGVSLNYIAGSNNGENIATGEKVTMLLDRALLPVTAKAYPNPFTSQITIQLPQTKSTIPGVVRVMDISGKIILNETTSASSITIGKSLPAGAYIVQILQANTLIYKTTIVKQ